MTEKLTKEQESKLSEYRDRWIKIGLSTDRINRPDAIKRWREFDRIILKNKKEVPIVFLNSPLETWIAVCMFKTIQVRSQVDSQVWRQVGSQVDSQVRRQVWNQVWSQVDSQVESQVRSQVWRQVDSQVESQVGSQVEIQVESQVDSQVRSQVRSQIWSKVDSQVESFIYPYLNTSFWAGYYGYYDFINKELGITFNKQKEWDLLMSLRDLSWIYPFEDICFISEKPIKINMKDGRLHCDGGASVEYADGFKCWSLHGIKVPQYLSETPSEQLDISFFEKEKNADVRTEFVRKYGVERLLDLGNKIDDWKKYNQEWWNKSEYELWDLGKLFNLNHAYHLKMKNQSVDGVFHVEAVGPECDTLPKAIQYRLKGKSDLITNIK
jgi:hypothetical protein